MCVCVCVYVYVYVCTCICVHVYVYVYVHMYVRAYVCMYVCGLYARVRIYSWYCMCVSMCIRDCKYARMDEKKRKSDFLLR